MPEISRTSPSGSVGSPAPDPAPHTGNARLRAVDEVVDACGRHWPGELAFSSWTRAVDELWRNFPAAFKPAFPGIARVDVEQLSAACQLLTRSIIAADDLMDPDTVCDGPTIPLQVMALQCEAYQLLNTLVGTDRQFWDRFRAYLLATARVNLEEAQYVTGAKPLTDFTVEAARRIAIGKASACKVALAGLASLADDQSAYPVVEASLDRWLFANQLYDDLRDWRIDRAAGQPSLLLAMAARSVDRPLDAFDDDALARVLHYDGFVQEVVQRVVAGVEAALQQVQETALSERLAAEGETMPWVGILESQLLGYQRLATDMQKMTDASQHDAQTRPRLSVHIPASDDARDERLRAGIRFLVHQHRNGFGEAKHFAKFPHSFGYTGETEVLPGLVFSRALVLEALGSVAEPVRERLRPLLQAEADALIEHRTSAGARNGSAEAPVGASGGVAQRAGGWAYYPGVPEWGPDAGTTAQVAHGLRQAGRDEDVRALCDPAFRAFAHGSVLPEGGFDTWTRPTGIRYDESSILTRWTDCFWNGGSRVEAVANLVAAVAESGLPDYEAVGRRARRFLCQEQRVDGTWTSPWYLGPYYPTFACVRALRTASPATTGTLANDASDRASASHAVSRAIDFLLRTQHDDGGWGTEASDAGNTALALTILATTPSPGSAVAAAEGRRRAAARAARYLRDVQYDDGGWPAHPFIVAQQGSNRFHSYRSRTVTTALVVRAFAAAPGLSVEDA